MGKELTDEEKLNKLKKILENDLKKIKKQPSTIIDPVLTKKKLKDIYKTSNDDEVFEQYKNFCISLNKNITTAEKFKSNRTFFQAATRFILRGGAQNHMRNQIETNIEKIHKIMEGLGTGEVTEVAKIAPVDTPRTSSLSRRDSSLSISRTSRSSLGSSLEREI